MTAVMDLRAAPRRMSVRLARNLSVAMSFAALLVAWELSSGLLFHSYFASKPSEIAGEIYGWAKDGYLWPHLFATLLTTACGFAIAATAGVAAGLLLGSYSALDRILQPFVYAGFSIPKVVLAPLMVFWFGAGVLPSLAMSAITAFFFVFFNVYDGVRSTSPGLLNMIRVLGAGPWSTAVKVRLPAAMPQVFNGLHQGLIYAFHGAVVGEMTASNLGIGYIIIYASTEMNSAGVLAGLTVLAAMSYGLVRALHRIALLTPGYAAE